MPSPPTSPNATAGRHQAAIQFLYDHINYEHVTHFPAEGGVERLERMRELLFRLGNPQNRFPIVHIAGTKGKGSTASMIAAVLSAAGYHTGLYTSPHIERVEERMAIDSHSCSSLELGDLVDRIAPDVTAMDRAAASAGRGMPGPTYFEITTAIALVYFASRQVDVAVIEVGMGGAHDATNVCAPQLAVITSISFDHTRQLGNSLDAIARQKAGIIKPGVPVVSGVAVPEAQEIIRQTCRRLACRLVEQGTDFHFEYDPPRAVDVAPAHGRLDFRYAAQRMHPEYRDLEIGLLGRHQAANAAVAMAAVTECQRAGWRIPEEAIRTGLANVRWPARVEVISRRPAVLIDAAHNVASVDALLSVLDESFSSRRRFLVFATTQEKDVRGMLSRLIPAFDEVVFTRYLDNPRAVPVDDLAAIATEISGRSHPIRATPAEAWEHVRAMAGPEDLICAAGSFFLVGEIRRAMSIPILGPTLSS
jgi:dihydrofolate synthase/folylpolyglutamate synthase